MGTSTLHLNNPVPSNGAVAASLGGRHTVTATLSGVGAISCKVQAWASSNNTDSKMLGAPVVISGTTTVSQTLTFNAGDCNQFWLALVEISPACTFNATVENSGDMAVAGAVIAGGVRVRAALSRMIRAATFGYSIDHYWSTNNQDIDPIVAAIPGGAVATQWALSGAKIGVGLRSKNIRMVGDFGVSGENVSQMMARTVAAASGTRKSIYDLISIRPDIVYMAGPLVNDAQLWNETTTTAIVDVVVDATIAMISTIANAVPHVAFVGCMGLTKTAWSAAQRAHVGGLINYACDRLETWAATIPNVHYLQAKGRLCDNNREWYAGDSDDGIHPNALGGATWADMLEETTDACYDVTNPDALAYDYSAVWSAPVSGNPVGTSTPAIGTAVVGTKSVVNGVWEIPFTAADADDAIYVNTTSIEAVLQAASLVAGDRFYLEWDVELRRADGTPMTLWGLDSLVRLFNAANEAGSLTVTQTAGRITRSVTGFATPLLKLDRDASALGTSSDTRLTITPLAAGSYVLRVYPPRLRVAT